MYNTRSVQILSPSTHIGSAGPHANVWDSLAKLSFHSLFLPTRLLNRPLYFLEVGKDNVTGEARKEKQQELLFADQSTGY